MNIHIVVLFHFYLISELDRFSTESNKLYIYFNGHKKSQILLNIIYFIFNITGEINLL